MTTYNPLQLLPLPPEVHELKPVATALTIDPYSDILWTGTSSGIVTAWCTPQALSRNVNFPAHGRAPSALLPPSPGSIHGVREIRATDREVWTLTEGGVGGRRRGGAPRFNVSDPTRSLRSMAANPINSHEILAGGVSGMMLINTSRGEIARRMDYPAPIVHLSPLTRTVVLATGTGSVNILDPRIGFKAATNVVPVQAHTGGLSGADAAGFLVCTWGWTHMQGHPMPDPLVRLYDVRTLRALPPLSFPAGPGFCLLHPSESSKVVVASQQGTLQTFDMSDNSSGSLQQLPISSYLTSMAISPVGDYLAFGDADGSVHVWTSEDTSEANRDQNGRLRLGPFNGYEGVKAEWPDEADPPPQIAWTNQTPLNVVGMPHYSEPLLSNFAPSDYAPVTSPFFNPPEPIPTAVLSTMKTVDFVGYATMPRELKGRRYVRQARPGAGKRATGKGFASMRRESGPRFRSEKDRKRQSSTGNAAADIDEELLPGQIPKYYRKVEIKYSKFGIEDFDFEFYNRTEFSGLETDILNSYTNALLQALHYTSPVRALAKAHICVDCRKEHCLLCEAGFLFRMLEDAKGVNCQATNFSRAFSATPQASALGLMDDKEKSTTPYGSLIQNFNRWLLSTFSAESLVKGESLNVLNQSMADLSISSSPGAPPTPVDQILGVQTRTTNTCRSCGFVTSRDAVTHTIDLQYPRKADNLPFVELLRSSIVRESSTKAACSNCKHFAPLESKRQLGSGGVGGLPSVLSLNAGVTGPDIFAVWKNQGDKRYLPAEVSMVEGKDGELLVDTSGQGVVYEIKALVVQIQESAELPGHLLSFAKVPAQDGDAEPHWVLFNDFLVRPVAESEVFSFLDLWKVPAVIVLQRKDAEQVLNLAKLPSQIKPDVLFKDVSLAWNRRSNMIKHKILDPGELPGPGTLIAIDAEFVALQQEEMEFRADGTKNILRPSHMSLARVSVLRGVGPSEGVPFIDDYIVTKEAIVDYLTEFSGIKSGDLDQNHSPHTLVPLKVAYKKLRCLVDRGCIFVGHGLSKDFRTINIFVPPDQVMDTVNIYTIPGRQRKLSLRFLSWFLLKKDIQTHMHDSIEDAKYALLLYKLYLRFEEDDRFEDVMEDIFVEGQRLGFKPPQEKPTSPPKPTSAPTAPSTVPLRGPGGRHQHSSNGASRGQHPRRRQQQQHQQPQQQYPA